MKDLFAKLKYKIFVFVFMIILTLGNWFLYHGWIIPNTFGNDAVLINMMVLISIVITAIIP